MNLDERREKIAQMSKAVFQYCLSRTNSYQESEDLSQEILLTLCESIENLRDEKAFYAFVWRTAHNILKDWYRKKDRLNAAELDDTIPDNSWDRVAEQAQENEQFMLITRELSLLNSNYRRVMVAYYIEGCSVKEISARFSLSSSMVKYLLFQSRKRIKEGITMERNFGEYSYNPVSLIRTWFQEPIRDYRGFYMNSIQQNIMMACYYEKQNEEQLSLQLGVPTAYLEDEIKELVKRELLSEKNGFYLTNLMIQTKGAIKERYQAKAAMLKETAEKIKSFFAENEEKIRAIGFYGSDMPVNSLKWLVTAIATTISYECDIEQELSKNRPDPKLGPFAELTLVEKLLPPKGDNYVPLWTSYETEHGEILCDWIHFNTPSEQIQNQRMTPVQANVLTMLPTWQPETENDKIVCTELIEKGLAVRCGDQIKPNFPSLTKAQHSELNIILKPLTQELYQAAMDRVELTKQITYEHTPDRFHPYVKDMMLTQMEEEVGDITRILVEENWIVRWTGMNPTNLIIINH